MKHGSLFSGIGGFDLAAEWAGWKNMFHCEWNPFGQKVLKHYWPNAANYEDITKTDFTIWRGRIDILTGGFPCQPYSAAGKRLGKEDERHLWPEMLRTIREIQPRWVVGENVLGLVNWNGGLVFEEVQADLEAEGYEVQPFILPAASVNAPHKRDRVWFVAYSKSARTRKNIGRIRSVFDGCYSREENAAPTTDTECIGFYRQKNEQELERKGCNELHLGKSGNKGFAPNTDHKGRSSGSGQVQETNGEIPKRDNDAKPCDTSNGVDADTASEGLEGRKRGCSEGKRPSSNSEQNAPHTNYQGLQGGEVNGSAGELRQESHELTTRFVQPTWDNFPTQSPICSRNDGLPTQLDGITFSKWRNESIKAGGNAIVPQVVYQIFKAINEYENLHTNRNNT